MTEEVGPERLGLGIANLEAEYLPSAVCCDTDRDHDRLRHDALTHAGFAIGCVDKHVRVGRLRQAAGLELGDVLIKLGADARYLGLRDPSISAECFHEVIDFSSRDPVYVGFHHDREQGLVDSATPFEQGGEERSLPEFRDTQIQIPGGRREGAGAAAIALRSSLVAAFVRGSADHCCSFGIDEFLERALSKKPDAFGGVGEFEFLQKLDQGRLG